MIRTILRVSAHKISAYFGGRRTLLILCLFLICLLAAASIISNAKSPDTVSVAIVDLCDGPYSRAFCDSVMKTEGIQAEVLHSVSQGEDKMLFDSIEVMLVLSQDYDDKISEDSKDALVTIKTAPGAESAQLLRETTAGLLVAQRSTIRIKEQLDEDKFDLSSFDAYMDEAKLPKLYSVETYGAEHAPDTFSHGLVRSSYAGVAALALLLILLTLTRRMSDAPSKLVSERIETQHCGTAIAFSTDYIALLITAVLISCYAFAFSPQKSFTIALAWIAYAFCISAICLLISRFNTVGRIDILAPFLAIVTSVIGGCFTDLSVLAPQIRIVTHCVPQGQLLAAVNGNAIFILIMFGESILLICLSLLLHKRRK